MKNDLRSKRPNILFAFADDWGRYASCYSRFESNDSVNSSIHTPYIDRVADNGVIFTEAFVPAPSCTPCRSSVLSGRYFWQTGLGAILQGAVWDDRIPTFPQLLRQEGYHTGFSYKVWSPGNILDAPYGEVRASRYERAGNRFGLFSFDAMENLESDSECNVEKAKKPLYDEVRQNFIDFIKDRNPEQPFCYWWGPTNTHREWRKGSGKKLWGIEPDSLKGKMDSSLPDVHAIREDFADYLGECMAFDRGLGIILNELEKLGELQNTFIVVSGDHGIPGFPRAKCNLYDIGCKVSLMACWPGIIPPGTVDNDVVNIMDLAPTFLDAAGIVPPADMTAKSLLGRMKKRSLPGKNYIVMGRERHVASARDRGLPYPQRALRTKDFLYIRNFAPERWPAGNPRGLDDPSVVPPASDLLEHNTEVAYADMDASPTKAWCIHNRQKPGYWDLFNLGFGKRPEEELYELVNDPNQMINLNKSPAHVADKERLADMLMQELIANDDPRVVQEICCFEQSPYTDLDFPGNSTDELCRKDLLRLQKASMSSNAKRGLEMNDLTHK